MLGYMKKLISKATAFSRQVQESNYHIQVGIEHEYRGKTVPVDYGKIKLKQKTKVPNVEFYDVKGTTKTIVK